MKHLIVEFEGVKRVATDISGRHKTLRRRAGRGKTICGRARTAAGGSRRDCAAGQVRVPDSSGGAIERAAKVHAALFGFDLAAEAGVSLKQ